MPETRVLNSVYGFDWLSPDPPQASKDDERVRADRADLPEEAASCSAMVLHSSSTKASSSKGGSVLQRFGSNKNRFSSAVVDESITVSGRLNQHTMQGSCTDQGSKLGYHGGASVYVAGIFPSAYAERMIECAMCYKNF